MANLFNCPQFSVDLVFTNWLMMYLSDSETVEFIHNCMRWLRPYGYVHLRESCSEPSTGRTKKNTMHDDGSTNPTHYRFSSLYINLLRSIRYRDEDGKLWRFDLHWSCSVPTYIKVNKLEKRNFTANLLIHGIMPYFL